MNYSPNLYYNPYQSTADSYKEELTRLNCSLATQLQLLSVQQQTQNIYSVTQQPPVLTHLIPLSEIRQKYYIDDKYCIDGSSLKPKRTNCLNCGAPLQEKLKCSYCDTYNE